MYVLKKDPEINKNKKLACDMDYDKYKRKYNSNYNYIKTEEINPYNKYTMITSNAMIRNYLAARIVGEIEYCHQNFIFRSTLGHWYPFNRSSDVFYLHYTLNVLGWIKDPFTKPDEVFRSNNIQLINLSYQLGQFWLHSYIQLSHACRRWCLNTL